MVLNIIKKIINFLKNIIIIILKLIKYKKKYKNFIIKDQKSFK
jgi:hypothetical protein